MIGHFVHKQPLFFLIYFVFPIKQKPRMPQVTYVGHPEHMHNLAISSFFLSECEIFPPSHALFRATNAVKYILQFIFLAIWASRTYTVCFFFYAFASSNSLKTKCKLTAAYICWTTLAYAQSTNFFHQ